MRRRILKGVLWCLLALIAAGLAAPFFAVDQYARRLQSSLERSLGRRVELQDVHFSMFKGPGFSVGRVVIYEDPAIGLEPVAYIEDPGSMVVAPSVWSLLGGRFVIASISLNDASINLTKSGPASEPGQWNFSSLISSNAMRSAPSLHVRNGRIHFKFGETKSVFYLTETDLDVSVTAAGDWKISFEGQPARSDRVAQYLGALRAKGRWYADTRRAEMDLTTDGANLGELTSLIGGQDAGVHGTLTTRVHFAGPLNNMAITGRMDLRDLHRWDLLPGNRQDWPLNVGGRLDVIGQQLELRSASANNQVLPLSVQLRATDYLSRPHWAVALNWNRFPIAPVLDLARNMGVNVPGKLRMDGVIDGAAGYSAEAGWQGGLSFHDVALTAPDSPPLRFDQAHLVLDHGHAKLSPALVRGDNDQARFEADWALDNSSLDLTISTDGMKVESLRAQAALASVPALDLVKTGSWSGGLRFHRDAITVGWSGKFSLTDAELPIEGFADPLHLASATVQVDGARLIADRLDASIGKLPFSGDYRYEPGVARPHRVRLRATAWDAADVERELMPTLRRSTGLIARALGRPMVTNWLRERNVEGSVQIGAFTIAGARLDNIRGRLVWNVGQVRVDGVQAMLDRTQVSGKLSVDLRGSRPTYRVDAKLQGLDWQSGKLDATASAETFGTGTQLLTNLNVDGAFTGTAFDLGSLGTARGASGQYNLVWGMTGPRLRLSGLTVRTEDETFTGQGATQDNGQLLVSLTNGERQMRMTGTLAKLRVE